MIYADVQFMQRKLEADNPSKPARLRGADNPSTRRASGKPQLLFLEGEGNPFIRHCPGRRSFGKFNVAMEDHALVQIKAYRKLLKKAAQSAGTAPTAADGGAPSAPDDGGSGEGKDVSDREMAAALKRPHGGGGGGPPQAAAEKRPRVGQ